MRAFVPADGGLSNSWLFAGFDDSGWIRGTNGIGYDTGAVNPSGIVIVDDGAAEALRRGTSLLPAGVVAVEGIFERGDAVIIRARSGAEAGRGLSAYSSVDIRLIAGHKSGEIADILGYRGRDEIIHRDDLVVTEPR